MESPADLAAQDGAQSTDIKLDTDIYLIQISRHCWQGEHVFKQQADAKIEVKGQPVDKKKTKKPAVVLIPDAMRKILSPGFAKVESVLIRYTINFCGAKAVSGPAKSKFFQAFKEARDELNDYVEQFVARYQEEVVEYNYNYWHEKLGDSYSTVIGRLLPDVAHIGSRFGYSIRNIQRLEAPGEDYKFFKKLDKEMLDEVRKNRRQDYEKAMDELVSGPRIVLAKALDEMVNQLQNGKVLKRSSFNGVLDAIALNRNFANTITDDALLAASISLQTTIEDAVKDAEANKSSCLSWNEILWGHKQNLLEAVTPVADAAMDSTAVEQIRRRLNARVRPVDV